MYFMLRMMLYQWITDAEYAALPDAEYAALSVACSIHGLVDDDVPGEDQNFCHPFLTTQKELKGRMLKKSP